MAGRVFSVQVVPGQEVDRGDTLLVTEAMKMETTLSAPLEGVVESVEVVEGDPVEPGDRVVTIRPKRLLKK